MSFYRNVAFLHIKVEPVFLTTAFFFFFASFSEFQDDYNIEDLMELKPDDAKAQIFLLGDFDPEGERIIRDPYCVSLLRETHLVIHFSQCYSKNTRRNSKLNEEQKKINAFLLIL